jgi:DNA (cytosine-5)-methyltransferase 1
VNVGSLCSGAGGLDLGLHHAGWRTSWFCEKIPYRRAVLGRHWPGVPIYEDLVTLNPADLEPVRLLAGGTPCTNLSIAGGRSGLDGDESRLFWDFMRIRNALEPEWTLWENVEGAFSSNEGLDFAQVLSAFVGADVVVPAGGWARAGMVAGPWGGASWRCLDAQHFGVPQRRRRVFVVGRLGGECPDEVLFESCCGARDFEAGGGSGSRVAGSLTGGSARSGVSKPGRRGEDDVNLVAGTLSSRYAKGTNGTADEGAFVFGSITGLALDVVGSLDQRSRNGPRQNQDAAIILSGEGVAPSVQRSGPPGSRREDEGPLVLSTALQAHRGKSGGGISPEETLVTHALTGAGFDASEDGTGRGTPLSVSGSSVRRLTPTEAERLMGWPDGFTLPFGPSLVGVGVGVGQVSTFAESSRDEVREGTIAGALGTGGGKPGRGYPAVRIENDPSASEGDRCAVDPLPDGRRYAACGDGVVAPVSEWIGRRIMTYEKEGR